MAMDKAHVWTDAELKNLERRIKTEYTKAYKELKKEMTAIMEKMAVNPDMTLAQKMVLMNKYDRFNKMCEQMAETLKDTNAAATKFVEKSAQNVFKYNYNFEAERLGFALIDDTAVRNMLTGDVNPFTKLAIAGEKDKSEIMRKLQSEMTTAILKGESIPNIARRLKSVSEGYLGNTIRIARTETTRVQNSARAAVGEEGKRLGFNMWKRWVATNDDRTRGGHNHDEGVSGTEVPIDEPFHVEIFKKRQKDGQVYWEHTGVIEELMYAGDISRGASAANVVNCRCTVVNVIKPKDFTGK